MMSVDRPTGETIARLMSHLRPEWDYPGCVAAVKAVARKPAGDVAMAAIRLSLTPEAKTPGALSVANGAHWRERLAGPEPRNPPRRNEDCPNHPGEWPESCRGCASDRLAGTETHANPRRTPLDTDAIAEARASLAAIRSTLCSHGIPHQVCKAKHETEADA